MNNYVVQDGCHNCQHCKDEDWSVGDTSIFVACCFKVMMSCDSKHHPVDPAGVCDSYEKKKDKES